MTPLDMETIDITSLNWNRETGTFTAEISSLPEGFFPSTKIRVLNQKTGGEMIFTYTRTDFDDTREDVYGWHYNSDDHHLLIIND